MSLQSRTVSSTTPVVLFSQNYLPMTRINLRRAAMLLVTERAEPLDFSSDISETGWVMRSPSITLDIPEHIRLKTGGKERIWKVPPVNRREVLRRDAHTCQYCGSKKRLTLDHVMPRSKGGQHTWDNVVAACAPCNSYKADRTPELAKMQLRRKPQVPLHPVIAFAGQFWKEQKTE
ncbi:MAG: HNH endonuclease [Cyanobacteria bacterium P01_D01_bin.36]